MKEARQESPGLFSRSLGLDVPEHTAARGPRGMDLMPAEQFNAGD